ncbi:carbon-nitrogen hydrolase [Dipodascopsis uninucleata]
MRRFTVACVQVNIHHGSDIVNSMRKVDLMLQNFFSNRYQGQEAAKQSVNAGLESRKSIDLLVLPELAFTGYKFASRSAITPYLEPRYTGRTTAWAQKTALDLNCHVIVGYPEVSTESNIEKIYNSAVVVSPSGEIVYNYRKCFLYEADKVWGACSGGEGFGSMELTLGRDKVSVKVVLGICMDLNPEEFTAPFDKYEFANFAIQKDADLIVLPMAWRAYDNDVPVEDSMNIPDWKTINYWAVRLKPLQDNVASLTENRRRVFIGANRTGIEDGDVSERTMYAGSSCVLEYDNSGKALVRDWLGQEKEGILFVEVDI